jgi:hypothetical protein
MSETSLFAELVKDKNLRELAMKRLAAIKEKEKDEQEGEVTGDIKILEATQDDINNIPIPMDNGPGSNSYPPLPQTVDQVSKPVF